MCMSAQNLIKSVPCILINFRAKGWRRPVLRGKSVCYKYSTNVRQPQHVFVSCELPFNMLKTSTPPCLTRNCLTSVSLQRRSVSFYNGCQAKESTTDLSPILYYVGSRKGLLEKTHPVAEVTEPLMFLLALSLGSWNLLAV